MLLCYLAVYLGVARLLVSWLSRWYRAGVVFSAILCVLLIALGTLAPLTLQFSLRGKMAGADEYTLLQASNVIWTIAEIVDNNALSFSDPGLPIVLGLATAIVFGVTLHRSAPHIIPPRLAVPPRVQQDELQLHPEKAPPPPAPSSPWDDPAP